MGKTTYLVSAAHEWAYEKGLCDRFGKTEDTSVRPEGGGYVPELACDDLFADYHQWTAVAENGETQSVSGIQFPDGSALYWTDDVWSVTDGDLRCISGLWQLE